MDGFSHLAIVRQDCLCVLRLQLLVIWTSILGQSLHTSARHVPLIFHFGACRVTRQRAAALMTLQFAQTVKVRSQERPINGVCMIDRIIKIFRAKMTGSRQMSYCNFISILHQNHSPSVLAPLTTVLPRKGNLSEVLCKPKIMPIKSLGTRGLTTNEKQDLSSGTFLCHVPVTSCDPNTSTDVTSLIRLSVFFVLKHRKFEASGKNSDMFPNLVNIPISSKYCSYHGISTFSKVGNLRAD